MKNRNTIPFWRRPGFRYGSLSTVLLCVFLAIVVLVNMAVTTLEKRNGWRMDYSFNALTTTSETTEAVLAALPYPVHIYALYTKGMEDVPLMELLNRYAAQSDMITWSQEDIALNPGLLTRFEGEESDDIIANDSLIVYCETTGRWRMLNAYDFVSVGFNYESGQYEPAGLTYESSLTSAIDYVTQTSIPRVMVLQGHGELSDTLLAPMAELLSVNHYEVVYFSLLDPTVTLGPDDLLMILSPTRDLMDAELDAIIDFIAQGGSIFFTCDYTNSVDQMPNYQALLRSYGFLPMDGLVVASQDEPWTYYQNTRINLLPAMQPTEATLDLINTGTDSLLLTGSRAFEMPMEEDQYLVVSPVLLSGSQSYLRQMTATSTSLTRQEGDPTGAFPLALQAIRFSETGEPSRAFVLGCSTLLTSTQIYAMTDAQPFIIRMVEHLFGEEPIDLSIMPKAALRPQLTAESIGLGSMILVSLPLAVLAAALIVLVPRRHR